MVSIETTASYGARGNASSAKSPPIHSTDGPFFVRSSMACTDRSVPVTAGFPASLLTASVAHPLPHPTSRIFHPLEKLPRRSASATASSLRALSELFSQEEESLIHFVQCSVLSIMAVLVAP